MKWGNASKTVKSRAVKSLWTLWQTDPGGHHSVLTSAKKNNIQTTLWLFQMIILARMESWCFWKIIFQRGFQSSVLHTSLLLFKKMCINWFIYELSNKSILVAVYISLDIWTTWCCCCLQCSFRAPFCAGLGTLLSLGTCHTWNRILLNHFFNLLESYA